MTYQKNDERREAIWNYYNDYHEMAGRCPTMQECGDVIGAQKTAVKHYIMGFVREGKMKIIRRRVYFVNSDGSVIDQRKISSAQTNAKKAASGRKTAEMLRKGTQSKDMRTYEQRIEDIVKRAEKNGTLRDPRQSNIVPVGQKVG